MRRNTRLTLILAALVATPFALGIGCSSEDDAVQYPPNTGNSGGSGLTGNSGGSGLTGNSGGSGLTGNSGGSGLTGGNTGGSGLTGGNTGGTAGSGAVGGGVGGGTAGSGGEPPCVVTKCLNQTYACGDCIDNDNDGRIDDRDGECLGPCDNTEGSYFGGIPGQTGPACDVDCYFDSDSGHGNDGCYWDHRCDPISIAPNYYPEPWNDDTCEYLGADHEVVPVHETCDTLLNADGQSQDCLDFCLPITPNGCDCFGCCELPAGSGEYVWLGSEGIDDASPTVCTPAEVDNPDVCHPCTPVTDCMNSCGHCEICIGKPELPPDCFGQGGNGAGGSGVGGGPPDQCPPGVQPCGLPGQDPCDPGWFCLTGCCRSIT